MRTKTIAAIACLGMLVLGGNAWGVSYTFSGLPGAPINPGDTFVVTVNLNLTGNSSLGHSVDVVWDSAVLSLIGSTEGGVPPYQLNITAGAGVPGGSGPNSANLEAAAFAAVPDPGAPFSVGTLTFQAIAPGAGNVLTTFSAGQGVLDAGGIGIPDVAQAGGVVNVIPEPGTFALMALGLGALAIAGRRR